MATYDVSNGKRGCSDAQRNKDNSGSRGKSRRGMGRKGWGGMIDIRTGKLRVWPRSSVCIWWNGSADGLSGDRKRE